MLKRPTDEVLPAMHFCPAMGEVYRFPLSKDSYPLVTRKHRDKGYERYGGKERNNGGKCVLRQKLSFTPKTGVCDTLFLCYRNWLLPLEETFGSHAQGYRNPVNHEHNECEFTASPYEVKEVGIGVLVCHIVILGWLFPMP